MGDAYSYLVDMQEQKQRIRSFKIAQEKKVLEEFVQCSLVHDCESYKKYGHPYCDLFCNNPERDD